VNKPNHQPHSGLNHYLHQLFFIKVNSIDSLKSGVFIIYYRLISFNSTRFGLLVSKFAKAPNKNWGSFAFIHFRWNYSHNRQIKSPAILSALCLYCCRTEIYDIEKNSLRTRWLILISEFEVKYFIVYFVINNI